MTYDIATTLKPGDDLVHSGEYGFCKFVRLAANGHAFISTRECNGQYFDDGKAHKFITALHRLRLPSPSRKA